MSRKPAASLHRRIIADALEIAWHHKHLWVFGFFATLIGFGGVSEAFFRAFDLSSGNLPLGIAGGSLAGVFPGYVTIRTIAAFSSNPRINVLLFLATVALIAAVFVWITVMSIGALISGTRAIVRGGEPHFSDGVKTGSEKFWPLFGVNLAAQAVTWLTVAITGANLAIHLRGNGPIAALFYVGSFVLGVIIAFFAALTAVYGSVLVIKKVPANKAFRDGFALASENWLVNLEMAVLLTVVTLAITIVVAFGTLVCSVPLIFLVAIASILGTQGSVTGMFTLTAVLLLCVIVPLVSFLTTFQTAAWTLLCEEELGDFKPIPKILRAIGKRKQTVR